jgi:hypothetical protein
MVVIGFNLKKILVERKDVVRGKVKVSTKMNILDVREEKTKIMNDKDVLSCGFEFLIQYLGVEDHKENVADIRFEGNVLCLVDPKDTKKIIEDWKKKELPQDLRLKVMNAVLAKCNVKALVLEDEIGLPSHLPLPKFKSKEAK